MTSSFDYSARWRDKPHFTIKRIVEPNLIVSIDEAKRAARVDIDDNDLDFYRWIRAATDLAESRLRRAILTQTLRLTCDRWPLWPFQGALLPWDRYVDILRPPVQNVSSVQYIDPTGVLMTWATNLYQVDYDSEPARLHPAFGQYFPATQFVANAVTIVYMAGYGDTQDSVPASIIEWILLAVSAMSENRELDGEASLNKFGLGYEMLEQHSLGDVFA